MVPYAEVEGLALQVAPPDLGNDSLAIRTHYGSLFSLAVLRGELEGEDQVPAQAAAFHRFVAALKPCAGSLTVGHRGSGAGQVQLGSFGLLCYVFERGCPPQTAEAIRSCRFGTLAGKDYVRCWVLDGQAKTVTTHRWLPFAFFPGRRYLQSLLT